MAPKSIAFVCWAIIAFVPNTSWGETISGHVKISTKGGTDLKKKSGTIVFLEGEKLKKLSSQVQKNYSMASKRKRFVPKVLPIMQGATVDFPNSDRILHNVFSLSKTKIFDLGLYKKGHKKSVTFEQSGLAKVFCNIHEKMVGYVVVLENSFFTQSDDDGNFSIENVPHGNFTITAWHWSSNPVKKEIEVNKSTGEIIFDLKKTKNIDLTLIQKNKPERHKNKWGKEYKGKY